MSDNNNYSLSNYSDAELIAIYKKTTNPEIIGELYKRYTIFTFGICLKYFKNKDEAKEAVLDIFEDLIDKLLNHNPENFRTWLYSVAKNYCLLKFRDKKIEYDIELLDFLKHDVIDDTEESKNQVQNREKQISLLNDHIKELKEEQKICIDLFYIQDKSYKEIEEITGYSYNNIKSYIQNGKQNLKKILEKHYGDQ